MSEAPSGDETLIERLERDPGCFEPVTAIRVAGHAAGEIRVYAHTGTQPAPLAVDRVRRDGAAVTLRSVLAGTVGTLGALPPIYNELVMREERNRSRALSAFLDLFGERIVELFVAASEKYRLARLLRWTGIDNGITHALFALVGFGTGHLRARNPVGDDVLLRFAGFFAARTRNASNLRATLAEFTGLEIEIEQFCGRWIEIPAAERSRLRPDGDVRLGHNATAGAVARDVAGRFRVVIGPVDYADYLSLAPGTPRIRDVFALARLFVGPALDFDVQVVLRKDQVPFCRLGKTDDPARLGWNSWARFAPLKEDSRDAVITQAA